MSLRKAPQEKKKKNYKMDLSTIGSLAGSTVLTVANWVGSSDVDNVVSKACDNLSDNSEKRNSSTVNDEMLKKLSEAVEMVKKLNKAVEMVKKLNEAVEMVTKLNEAVEMVDSAAHSLEHLVQVATVRGTHSPSESRQEAGDVLRSETSSFIAKREVR